MSRQTKQSRAYEFLEDGPKSVQQIAKHIGCTTEQAGQCMKRLCYKGMVEYIGDTQSGIYVIVGYRQSINECANYPKLGIWGL